MEEVEFLESEVIFQENVLNEEGISFPCNLKPQNSTSKKPRRRRKKQKKKNSIPINIPENAPGYPWIQPVVHTPIRHHGFDRILRPERIPDDENETAGELRTPRAWMPFRRGLLTPVEADFFDDEGEQFVPPHVIVGRRIFDRKMAFSLCSGNGRTLKGRDLSQVRNSVLRMTGFLET